VSDGPEINAVGDLVLTDPEAMRALAHPIRLALLDHLQREGPATAGELAAELEVPAPPIQEHLRELETFGLVQPAEEDDSWSAVTKGLVFEIPDDPEGQAEWVRAAGVINSRVTLTPDELRGLQEGLEGLLEPFITREADDIPFGATRVRILGYFLPEADE
jgi:DNA-binding transcriptional ArsR family regulator